MYRVVITKRAAKEIKKRGKPFKRHITTIVTSLSTNPTKLQAERLSGELDFLYSHHFSFAGTSYRLAYTIDEEAKTVTIVFIAPRENFYEKLRRMVS